MTLIQSQSHKDVYSSMTTLKLQCCAVARTSANLHGVSPEAAGFILFHLNSTSGYSLDKSYWFELSNDLIFVVLRDKKGGENTDPTKCNFTTPVTSTCFVNLAPTLLPWGLSMEMWCVDVPASVASTTGACKSGLHISYNIVGSEGQAWGKTIINC